ncbi:MAG TPA: hypothetical protein VM901_00310 [Bdellovibrionota bacterium]|nr:hypothetical protein [Bdellovibrionota bacterium]
MSLKPSPAPKRRAINRLAIYLGLGLGFSGELMGSAWVGWWVGTWWMQSHGGSKQMPGLMAGAFMLIALCHVVWLLLRYAAREEQQPPGSDT